MSSVEFFFRVWVHPVDGDPPDIEIWYQGLEPTEVGTRFRFSSEWAEDSFSNEDFHELFDLTTDEHWQVVGKARIEGDFDYWGEYDEQMEVLEFEKAKVPNEWVDYKFQL